MIVDEDVLGLRYLGNVVVRLLLSALCAGATYFVWLGGFLLSKDYTGPVVRGIFWLTAPVATAIGFAAGIVIHQRLARSAGTSFIRILIWPLAGCTIGAVAVYWYGPMLIVFGMFAAGTASIALRELLLRGKERKKRETA